MREILFRGKRLNNGEWIEGSLLDDGNGGHFICPGVGEDKTGRLDRVHTATVGQYTGLQDMNGNRIFEGDIVCVDDSVWGKNQWEPKKYVCEIVFREQDARFTGIGKQRPREWLYSWNARSYEVIGNIFDNPELLGGG